MSRLAGIHDLAYCFTRLGGAGNSAYKQDWGEMAINLGGMAGKGLWYGRNQIEVLKKALEVSGKKILPTPTAIVDITMVVISILDFVNGVGVADKGAAFLTGADKLALVQAKLELAELENNGSVNWEGDAAQEYAAANAALQLLADTFAELDKKVADLMGAQAAQVDWMHKFNACVLIGLVAAQGVALALYLIPIVGPELSWLWQFATAVTASALVFGYEMKTLDDSMTIADRTGPFTQAFMELGQSAETQTEFAVIEVTAADKTTVPDFSSIMNSGGLSGLSMTGVPTTSSLLAAANLGGSQTGLGALDVSAEVPVIDEAMRMSTRAATFSGHINQHMSVVNQATGSVQQIVSMAQQGQANAAAAGDDEDALAAGAVDDTSEEIPLVAAAGDGIEASGSGVFVAAAASPGAQEGERAPVDAVAVDGAHVENPTGAPRPL